MGALAVLLAACAGLAGCSTAPAPQEIHGEITLDEQPVTDGRVRFTPQGDKAQSAEALIKDGKYTTTLLAGNYKVEVFAPRKMGKRTDRPRGPGANISVVVETIPAKYNTESQLTAEVKPADHEIPFKLTTK